jgi:hypothetical protein
MNQYTSVIDGFNSRSPSPQPQYVQSPQIYSPAPVARPSVNKRQKIVEVIIEKPVIVHKYVDVEEEIIIEKPVERLIEQEIYIERVIEVPVEKIIENEVEIVREEVKEIIVEKEVEY